MILAPPAEATSVLPGWEVSIPTATVFLGDPINISIRGPAFNQTVQVKILDPNGTVIRDYYPRFEDGRATYNYTTQLTDPSGDWRVVVVTEGREAAYVTFNVLFDELNYLSKRVSLLEKRDKQQHEMISNLIEDNKRIRAQASMLLLFLGIEVCLLAPLLVWGGRSVLFPAWEFLRLLDVEFLPRKETAWFRFWRWFLKPYSSSEMKQFHLHRRLLGESKWPARAIAARVRAYGVNLNIKGQPKKPRRIAELRTESPRQVAELLKEG